MSRKSLLVLSIVVALGAGAAQAADAVKGAVQPPAPAEVKARLDQWLGEQKVDQAVKAKVNERWAKLGELPSELDMLGGVADCIAVADANAAKLVALCAKPKSQYILPAQDWLADEKTPNFIAHNLRLYYGRWLVQAEMFDEAMQQLAGLDPPDVVAPATLLFYQGVTQHTLLEKDAGLKTLAKLLKGSDQAPKRYTALAKLLEEDLKSLEDESLDHVARRMGDVRRKLAQGKGGRKTRDQEDGIVESLDKIIKKLEDQQSGGGGGGGMQDNIRSSSPAPDSMPIGGKGPGDVAKRNIGSSSDWGDLPPAEREKALQDIGRDMPPHFRDVIEAYFRRLASEESD